VRGWAERADALRFELEVCIQHAQAHVNVQGKGNQMRHKKVGIAIALLVLLLSVVLGATVLREPIAYAASPIQNVFIANTASQPVPVTVGNLPVVQNVAVQAPELWGKRISLAGTAPSTFICPPAGKKFIVQSFSARAIVPVGSHIVVYMRTGDFDSGVYLPLQNVGDSDWVGTVTGPVLAIVQAGCLYVAVEGFTNNLNGILDGYLLPA
jgi:hypothetical protein